MRFGICHSPRRSHVSAGPCEISRQSWADDPDTIVFWSPPFLRICWFWRGSSTTSISHFSFCSLWCFCQRGFNRICLQTSHEVHRSCKRRNIFTPCSISMLSLLLGVFRIYWSSRCLEICLGLIIFLLTYRASLSRNQFSPSLDWVSSWKMVFPSESIISVVQFNSFLRSWWFLGCCLLSLWQMSFLKPLERTWGNPPSFYLECDVCCVPSEPNVLRCCNSSATDTAIHVHSQVCRNGSEHHVLGDSFPFTFCASLCLGLSLAIISAQLEQLQDFLSV